MRAQARECVHVMTYHMHVSVYMYSPHIWVLTFGPLNPGGFLYIAGQIWHDDVHSYILKNILIIRTLYANKEVV